MFDALLKTKFYSKCKTAIKMTKARIEIIKRKRNAMQKFLRKDIADLLRNGLDINAYGRAEGLLVELNMSANYDFIEQFCGCISNHLSLMNKQRECPEECQEAVSSLMFAAARFADMPELRELRSIFAERYGNSLDANVNKEFVEKLKAMPPTKDMKLQLLQDIALESAFQWDSKALEQKLYHPPASEQDCSDNTKEEKFNLHKTREEPVKKTDKQNNLRDSDPKRSKDDPSSYGRKHVGDHDRYKPNDSAVCGGDPENAHGEEIRGQQKSSDLERNAAEEKAEDKKPFYYKFMPPPYTKTKAGETEKPNSELPPAAGGEDNPNASVGEEAKPKPRSVRRRRLKPPPGRDIIIGSEEGDHGTRQEAAAKQGLKITNVDGHDQKDEEERMMDRLLMHYSTKPSPYDVEKAKEALKPPPSRPSSADIGGIGSKIRTKSLPPEPTSPTETIKGHARASSYQPDSGHVHPKLPDYDDFVARLAALRGE